MKTKSLAFTLTCLLSCFAVPVLACCDPPQPPCYRCEGKVWVWNCSSGQICCNGSCCSNTCCNNIFCCSAGQSCCVGSNCYNPATQKCCTDSYPYYLCGLNQCCRNGTCGGTCWTTTTIEGWEQYCPNCDNDAGGDYCPGQYKKRDSYSRCWPASTGQAGRCECYETEQVIGYDAECKPIWDWSALCLCPVASFACGIVCGGAIVCKGMSLPADAGCILCIIGIIWKCGEPCDYVDYCEEDDDTKVEKTNSVFSHFGGGSCTG